MSRELIKTVNGFISPLELGFCQCHEHVFIKGDIDDYALSLKELELYKGSGGCSLVDAGPQNLSANLEVLKRLSMESGVRIIASTGFHKLSYYRNTHDVFTKSKEDLAEMFVKETEAGAGVIKVCVCGELKGTYRKLHESAIHAAKVTGSPVMFHVDEDTCLPSVINFYMERGISPDRLIICHADRFVKSMEEHLTAAGLGAYLEYDTIARPKYHDDAKEVEIILYMLDKGFGHKILLGLDTTKDRLFSYGGNVGLDYILKTFIPLLLDMGVDNGKIYEMTVLNCRKALEFRMGESV
jgi:predicted metal-dependent phosphotriesterase family hydrolase